MEADNYNCIMRNVFEMRIELYDSECCASQSVHIRHIHFYLYLFISHFVCNHLTSLPAAPFFPTPFNCFPMSRKRATTSFLSKTKNQIENDRTLSFNISRSFQWKLLGELSRRRGLEQGKPMRWALATVTWANKCRQGGSERGGREMGLSLCCYCTRGQSSLNKLATHRRIQPVGNCDAGWGVKAQHHV